MRVPPSVFVSVFLAAGCASGPLPLGYGLPSTPDVRYAYGDTTLVSMSVLGQSMAVALEGEAEYRVVFAEAMSGVGVTLSVERMEGSLSNPLGPPQRFDGSEIEGVLAFSLDALGNATVTETPEVPLAASRMISSMSTAHTFFPGLPGRVVSVGDQWIDTVSYGGGEQAGGLAENTVVEYTVVGDTTVDGRSLTKIALSGLTELSGSIEFQGMSIEQASSVELSGHVLWDEDRRLMVELVRGGTGSGSLRVPMLPQPVPTEVELAQRTSLMR